MCPGYWPTGEVLVRQTLRTTVLLLLSGCCTVHYYYYYFTLQYSAVLYSTVYKQVATSDCVHRVQSSMQG